MSANTNNIQQLYVAYFGRPADATGLAYWETVVAAQGGNTTAVSAAFSTSAEYMATFAGLNNDQIVNTIYNNLFHRDAEPLGLTYWSNLLTAGKINISNVVTQVAGGALTTDATALAQKVAASVAFTAALDTTAEILSYSGAAANAIAKAWLAGVYDVATETAAVAPIALNATVASLASAANGLSFTLTTGSDAGAAFTGGNGNDTFNAGVVMAADGVTLVNTLQSIDSLTGGLGIDSLNATLNSAGAVAPSLNGIEIINLRATAVGASLDLTAATGVTNVNVAHSTAATTITAIGNAALGVANQNTAVSIDGSTATALGLNFDTVGTKTAHITVDLASVTANAATSYAITAKNAYVTLSETAASAATTSATVVATNANQLTFGAADLASLTSLAVTGSGSVDFSGGALSALTSLTVADGGVKATITNLTPNSVVVTTGAGTDTISAEGVGVKSIATGAGDDHVTATTTALAAAATVDLGAGNDTLTLGLAFATGATLAGGDGTDTLGIAKADYATVSAYAAADLAKVTGFEVLSITDTLGTGDIIDVSSIAGITSFKAAAGITSGQTASAIGLGANSTIELAGPDTHNGTLIGSLLTPSSSDSLTLILNHDFTDNNDTTANVLAALPQAVTLADIESLVVKSTGTLTSAPFTPVDGYKADTITNTLDLTGSDKLTSITVTGDQALTLASTAGQTHLASVDGSANTAGLNFDGHLAAAGAVAMTIHGSATAANTLIGTSHNDTIIGGAKADAITGGVGGDTLTGNGGNDTFIIAAGDSVIGSGTFDTITDFVANTYGAGVGGAVDTHGAVGVTAAKLTGDLLEVHATFATTDTILTYVAANAADATTFLATNHGLTTVAVALDSSASNLYVDNTGDGVADIYIHLTGVTTINAAAILLV